MGFLIISGPSSPLQARALAWFTALMAAGGLGACVADVGAADQFEADPCSPGEEKCVCKPDQSCNTGLVCIRDICAPDPESAPVPDPTPKGSEKKSEKDSPDSAKSKSPDPKKSKEPDSSEPDSSEPDSSEPDSTEPSPKEPEPGEEDPSEDSPKDDEGLACSDKQRNFRETDIDCGGPICKGCELTQSCRGDVDCLSGVCENLVCVACSTDAHCDDNNPCTTNRCQANECIVESIPEGETCDDNDPCTAKDRCQAGSCVGKTTVMIAENFDDGGDGWRYAHDSGSERTLWQIGEAQASDCGQAQFGQDPAQDHTQNGSNAVAGVQIGGCQTRQGDSNWDCIWSKDVDVSHFDEAVTLSYWRHLHSPARSDHHGVENRIVYRVNRSRKSKVVEKGYKEVTNDSTWLFRSHEIKSGRANTIAIGICYRKQPRVQSFAGWSIDDVTLRQAGCHTDK